MKYKLFLLLLLNFSLRSFAQDVATAKWMHVNVDGNADEWGSLNFYDDQTQLNFGIANDSNNIYLCFQTINEPVQMKIMRAGMKVTLSAKGKSKHEATILFPLTDKEPKQFTDSSHGENMNTGERVFNRETFRQNFIAHHSTMEVTGFANATGVVPVDNSDIHVAINWDSSSNLVYEIAIAKTAFFGASFSPKEAMDDIMLSVEVNGLAHSASYGNGNAYHGGGMHGGSEGQGMHGFGGSGMHNGMHGGSFNRNNSDEQQNNFNNSNNISLSSKTSFKQKFVLNNKTD